jgi:hypothetical protein
VYPSGYMFFKIKYINIPISASTNAYSYFLLPTRTQQSMQSKFFFWSNKQYLKRDFIIESPTVSYKHLHRNCFNFPAPCLSSFDDPPPCKIETKTWTSKSLIKWDGAILAGIRWGVQIKTIKFKDHFVWSMTRSA